MTLAKKLVELIEKRESGSLSEEEFQNEEAKAFSDSKKRFQLWQRIQRIVSIVVAIAVLFALLYRSRNFLSTNEILAITGFYSIPICLIWSGRSRLVQIGWVLLITPPLYFVFYFEFTMN